MKTALSTGLILMEMLKGVGVRAFPVVGKTGEELPYICYRRTSVDPTLAKGAGSADKATVTLNCWAATYQESMEIAEAVREALDRQECDCRDLQARAITMIDASEDWEGDAYCQILVFRVSVGK